MRRIWINTVEPRSKPTIEQTVKCYLPVIFINTIRGLLGLSGAISFRQNIRVRIWGPP